MNTQFKASGWCRHLSLGAVVGAAALMTACGTVAPPSAPLVGTVAKAPPVPAQSAPAPAAQRVAKPPPKVVAKRTVKKLDRPSVNTDDDDDIDTAEPGDAVPRVDRIAGVPNRPYEIKGEPYVPHTEDVPMFEIGIASWYGQPFHGRRTSNGERYNMNAMTAAHKTMPLPSYAVVTNKRNGRKVVVRVNDRGPFVAGRVIDLSHAAARKLGIAGIGQVEVRRLTHAEIRTGSWRDDHPTLASAR